MKTASNMSSTEANTLDDEDVNAVFNKLSDGHEKSTVTAMESDGGGSKEEREQE